MALAVLLVLMLAMVGASDGAWCVCKHDASSSDLQKAIDYACGTNANCGPILQNGSCYNPNTLFDHCSYAANSYYQKNNQNQQACIFSGTAQLVTADPSPPGSGCIYPATPSAAGGSGGGGGGGTTPGTSPPTAPGTTPGTSPPTAPGTTPGTSPPTAPGSSLTPPPPGTGFTPGTGFGPGTGTGTGFGGLGPTGTGLDGSDAPGLVPPMTKLAVLVLVSATVYLLRV